ncbi:MAG: ATP-binding protein [Planctomycetota bacterium]
MNAPVNARMNASKALISEFYLILLITCLVVLSVGILLFGPSNSTFLDALVVIVILAGVSLGFCRMTAISKRVESIRLVEFQLSNLGATQDAPLQPIVAPSQVGSGWNRLVKTLEERKLDESIDRRLQQNSNGQQGEKFARALRSLNEGIAISDASFKLSYANTAFLNLLGKEEDLSEEDFTGRSILKILNENDYSNWEEEQNDLSNGNKPVSTSLWTGTSVHDGVHQITRLPLEGRVGEPAGFIWTVRDVTQQSIAQESHEQFLASATHELRTPLTNIRAYTESLLTIEDVTPGQQKEFYNVIHSEAGRLGRLLNELLDIQQLEAGSMTIQTNQFEIHRMIQEVQEHLGPLVEEKGLSFTCRIAPDLTTIEADKERVTSCLINLLGNAVKYTPSGGEVRLLAERTDEWIEIVVVDTGIGIHQDELESIFDRFYRCKDERVIDIEGNGLGLAFSLEVARLHGGDLVVESQIDKGSRFTLRLPTPNEE